jgi:hypothetical protein
MKKFKKGLMEKLDKPLSGKTVPIFYGGTLEEKYSGLLVVQDKIGRISKDEDTRPSDKLLDERGELELEISRHLTNGEVLDDPFMDYCLRHFNGGTTHMENNGTRRSPSVFDRMPRVKRFIDYVEKNEGKKILSTYGGKPNEAGIIEDSVKFEVDGCFRTMCVPVKGKLKAYVGGKWKDGANAHLHRARDFYVSSDIFSHPQILVLGGMVGGIWETNHSNESYVGGPGPSETGIYIGEQNIKNALTPGFQELIPERKKTVVASFPNLK